MAVRDEPDHSRFVATGADGSVVGFAAYRLGDQRITFTHTEVAPEMEGQGVGGALVQHALDDARRRGLQVEALCPYVRSWIDRHPDYSDLLGRAGTGSTG